MTALLFALFATICAICAGILLGEAPIPPAERPRTPAQEIERSNNLLWGLILAAAAAATLLLVN